MARMTTLIMFTSTSPVGIVLAPSERAFYAGQQCSLNPHFDG